MLLVSTDSFFIRWSEAEAWDIVFLIALFSLPTYVLVSLRTETVGPLAAFRASPLPLLAVAVLAGVTQICFVTAVTRTAVANVVVIVAAAPVLAALIARVFFREHTARRVWVAIAITFGGVSIIVAGSVGEPNLDGDLLAVLAVAAFAINLNIWRQHPQMSRLVGLSLSALLVIAVSAWFASPFDLDARGYLGCLGMGLVFNPLGRLLHTNAPRYAPAAEVALFTPVETIAATRWAWLAFSEAPALATMIGGVIVIAGGVYGTIARRSTR
jgi:drug/metabolite transporter (DMT)-like permease